jgi:hypothetical protein
VIFYAVAIALVVALGWLTTRHPPCTFCGLPYDYPAHFICFQHGVRCRYAHHTYRQATWPSLLVFTLLVVDLVAFWVIR